jgi:hypothetical protein
MRRSEFSDDGVALARGIRQSSPARRSSMLASMSQTETRPMPGTRLRGYSASVILVVGVFLVPVALTVVFNSWTAPDAIDYVRMAFVQVAGATIAIGTVVGLVVHRIVRRSPGRDIAWFTAIAVAIIYFQVGNLSNAAASLLDRLGI